MSKSQVPQVSIRECFADLQDPRREHLRLYSLWDIIALTICAVVCGADSWVDVANYGHEKFEMLLTFLDLENGIPAHDTIGRVFALLDPGAFQEGFARWVNALVKATKGRLVAIDGKTLRHSFDTKGGKGALHLVSAWATENNLTLGQQAVDSKSNEITAIPELLRILDLTGAIVTIDAMGCQKDIAAGIRNGGGHYILSLKRNHETFYDDVSQYFMDGLENDFAGIEHHSCHTIDEGHGRKEARYYHVVPVPSDLAKRHPDWKDLKTLGMVYSERQVGELPPMCDTRFYILSLKPKVKTFARAVRKHWGIENKLHWILDVGFREDESRLRKDHGPENMAMLRRMAASLLKRESKTKVGVACKRKKAGWNDDYLVQVLSASLT